jgi:hypothetical protein
MLSYFSRLGLADSLFRSDSRIEIVFIDELYDGESLLTI